LQTNAGSQFDPAVVDALLEEVVVEAAAAPPVSRSTRMLVVEDNAGLKLALEQGLAAEGFDVTAVGDAESAYECVQRLRPELVLLDWILPGGGGAFACRKLLELNPGMRIIVFTGLSDLRDRRAALEAGASEFLQKGIPLEALAERLRLIAAES
jgi:DNA-binding response OmpR family regulator